MHVGHARGAVFGDALANLLAFAGRQATREYYINDAGAQVNVLARSAFLRYREALGEDIGAIPEGLYPGDYLKPVGEALKDEFGAGSSDEPESEWLPLVRKRAIDAMMALIRDDLAALNITHEVFASERELTGVDGGPDRVREAIDALRAKGPRLRGPPAAAQRRARRTTGRTASRRCSARPQFGDDVDRPLIKSDGGYTYFASDIAYHKTKIDRGFLTLVDVWGADHGGYVKRMQAAVRALSDASARLEVRLCQLVRLMRAGEQVKMSKRSGDFVTLREVVDEVGRGRRALHHADAQERRPARLRPRQGDRAEPGQSGLLRPVRPRPGAQRPQAGLTPSFPISTSTPDALAGADLALADRRGRAGPHPGDGAVSAAGAAGGRGARAASRRILRPRPGDAVPRPLESGQRPEGFALR